MSTSEKKVHGHGNFVTESVRVVDYDTQNNNILVRGSSAFGAKVISNGSEQPFVIGDLISIIQSDPNFPATGITIGSNPLVIDFCLIGFAGTATVPAPARHHSHSGGHHKDQHIVEAEMGWFTSSKFSVTGDKPPYPVCIPSNTSNPGLMVYWPILSLAAGIAPTSTSGSWPTPPSSATISVEPGSGNYNYAGLIPAIYAALTNNPSGIPNCPGSISSITDAIIYVHCDSGVNRTGAAVAGYLMTYGSNAAGYGLSAAPATPYTLQQAQNAANKFHPGNDPQPYGGVDIPVAEAYCQMINSSDKKTISGPLNANCVPLSNT